MSSSPDRRSSAARASRVQARARNCPGHQRQIAPQSQHPAARSSSPASSRTRPRSSSAPTSRSVFHFTEGQRGPPAAADRRAPAPQRGRGHQALVQDRDTNPAAVAEATPERKAAIEQVAGLGLTGHTCALVQVSRPAAGRSATPPSTSARRRRVEPPADAVDRCRDARRRRGQAVTERALRDLRAAQAVEHRHLGSEVVGDAVSLDTMWVGNLKGEGKVWQYTASTAAASRSPGSPLGTGGSFRRWRAGGPSPAGPSTARHARTGVGQRRAGVCRCPPGYDSAPE